MPGRYRYKQAFITSPKLNLAIIEVCRISDGIALLEALGEGQLLVSTRRRTNGYFSMATCSMEELRGKSEEEIYLLLDRRMDQVTSAERPRLSRR